MQIIPTDGQTVEVDEPPGNPPVTAKQCGESAHTRRGLEPLACNIYLRWLVIFETELSRRRNRAISAQIAVLKVGGGWREPI
ncbi:hypothetical protein DMENIID0001_170460 [Sergentomyia squamirostris]